MLATVLIVILVLALLGVLPRWTRRRNWGYYPTGGAGIGPRDCCCPTPDGADLTAINNGMIVTNRCSRSISRTRAV